MQFTALTLSAFAATAFAQLPSGVDPSEIAPILSVLQTALPSSLLAEALTNPAAVSSEVASSLSAGQTPGWFSSLPTSIQTLLVPASVSSSLTSALSSSSSSSSAALSSSSESAASSASSESAVSSAFSSASSLSEGVTTTPISDIASSLLSTTTTPGAAAAQTAAYGMGIAGALGVVGLLAL